MDPSVAVLIPARDEAETIAQVVRSIPRSLVGEVLVVDNGSVDGTAERAREAGARVVTAPRPGYGNACLVGLEALPKEGVVVFLVADGSDDPEDLAAVLAPILEGRAELVLGSRTRGKIDPGAMTRFQRAGSLFAAAVLTARFGRVTTDLGPFRAIRRDALDTLGMRDRTYGWTIEMQIKAARKGLRVVEVPVRWRHRQGGSPKVAGTLRGALGATRKILAWLQGALLGEGFDPR
jgi:glycosyltransferase involved in cell wall biosynthesis